MDIEQCIGEALFLQCGECVQNCMVLESGGDDVRLSFLLPDHRGGADRLVVCLAPAGCEGDLCRLRADRRRDLSSCLFKDLFRPLAE